VFQGNNIKSVKAFIQNNFLKIIGASIVIVFLLITIEFSIKESLFVFESPILLLILNTIFLGVIPLAIAFMAAKSYQTTGILAYLMIGCGLLFFGVSSIYAGLIMPMVDGPNSTITLHNTGCLFAGLFEIIGADLFLKELFGVGEKREPSRPHPYIPFYVGIFSFVSIIAVLTFFGKLPIFFDPLTGPSLLRQIIIAGSILLFFMAGLIFIEIYTTAKTDFAYWFGQGLLLICFGLTCLLHQRSTGSMLNWIGRSAQYVGSGYFFLAFLQGQREGKNANLPVNFGLWPYLEKLVQERTSELEKINQKLAKEIYEHQQALEDLTESENRFRSLFEQTHDGVFILDLNGNHLITNQRAADMLGYAMDEVRGLSFNETSAEVDESKGVIKCLLAGENVPPYERKFRKKHGEIIFVEINVELVRDRQGNPLHIQSVVRDITERKQAADFMNQYANQLEMRVQERTSELVHANHIKDEFLSTMSHELRTPLNSVLGFSEILLARVRGPLNEKQEEAVGMISSSGEHLLSLINDILDVSKIEAGKFDFHPEILDVDNICQSSLIFIKQSAMKKNIKVEYLLSNANCKIVADSRRLKQILINLLNNAVKFTPENGSVILEVQANAKDHLIRFSVLDTGIGISPEDIQRLFKPFVQVDSTLSRQYEGTGLGLTLVKKLVEMHGGSVEVRSEVGAGSEFSFVLPCGQ